MYALCMHMHVHAYICMYVLSVNTLEYSHTAMAMYITCECVRCSPVVIVLQG